MNARRSPSITRVSRSWFGRSSGSARRVVCRTREGLNVKAGERYGVMKFGSRMDVFVPADAILRVRVGDTVVGGVTVIATHVSENDTGCDFRARRVEITPGVLGWRRTMQADEHSQRRRLLRLRPLKSRPERARRFRRGVYLLPSMFTMANMFCGYACIVHAMRGELSTAALFIGFAFVLDMLDGRIARMTGTTSAFGVNSTRWPT